MVARKGKKDGRRVKSLSAKPVSANQAKIVKGGPTAVEMPQLGVNYRGANVEINWGDSKTKR